MNELPASTPAEAVAAGTVAAPPDSPAAAGRTPRYGAWMVVILLAGLLGRAALSVHPGHTPDVELFVAWMKGLAEHGLGGFYQNEWANYPPFYILVLRALGELTRWVGLHGSDALAVHMLQRLPASLADVALAVLLYREGRRVLGARLGLSAAAIYYLNPVSFYVSGYWGQVDSIHSLFVLAALVALNRSRPTWAGVAIGLALLQKLQSIAFVPLVLFDVYRRWHWKGVLMTGLGGLMAAVLVMTPFLVTGSAKSVLQTGYGVVGQYPRLSINAFNVWSAVAESEVADTVVPRAFIRAAAEGADSVAADARWFLALTWRRLGSAAFIVAVAVILSVYARRWDVDARWLAAAGLGLAMFVFLTEMHERYLYPVVAILPLWAVRTAWRERFYVFASALLLLNLTQAQPVSQIAVDIGVANGLVLLSVLALLALPRVVTPVVRDAAPAAGAEDIAPCKPDRIVRLFQVATALAAAASLVVALLLVRVVTTAAPLDRKEDVVYLSDLVPRVARQGYRSVTRDADVEGSPIRLGDTYYLKGVGSHADAVIEYAVPRSYSNFEADVGIQQGFAGNARVLVELDGRVAARVDELTANAGPTRLSVPLAGATRLRLKVESKGSNKGDHVNWGAARFVP
ncbi:MAG: DUF2029 domain-containing protein [Phycisphaerales bacterium]|nr:MAG: DUF2029 domain-containing protein [Phycisphaerales bacterium]